MRIGIDLLAIQSPHHGQRGIGRYFLNLVWALLERDDEHEYVLYLHEDLSAEQIPEFSRGLIRAIRPRWELGETMTFCMDRLARTNPDDLDLFLVGSPFESWASYTPPAAAKTGLKMASIVYDLIPFLFPVEFADDPSLNRHYRVLEELKRYDFLLAISEATRRDCLDLLKLSAEQVVTIGSASDGEYFVPDRTRPTEESTRLELEALGINRPFVLNVGGVDPRKNMWKLIEAFAELPEPIRSKHQLVLAFRIGAWHRLHLLEEGAKLGLEGSLIVTGEVPDATLLHLYQQCELFVFPSSYEGFGLPILEAMHCGAPVIGGNNSSQIDVVGDAGLLVDPNDVHDIAAKMARVLENPSLARDMTRRSLERSTRFSWSQTASIALQTFARPVAPSSRRVRADGRHSRKPTIAFVSPFAPQKSGISRYSDLLIEELRKTYEIDHVHDAGYVPDAVLGSSDHASYDSTLFERMTLAKDYHAIVYQMGNSRYHFYMYDMMLRHPGLMTLHDFGLFDFHLQYGRKLGIGSDFLFRELDHWYPESVEPRASGEIAFGDDWDATSREFVKRGWYLNRHVLDASRLTVVHSPWCVRQIDAGSPGDSEKVVVIPHGVHPRQTTPAQRAEIRARYDIAQDALVFASFGFVHPDKMQTQTLDAFAPIARGNPNAIYLFCGQEADNGEVRQRVRDLGLTARVRFLGRLQTTAFDELMVATDIGVNLRLPPTNGETSGALLNLLGAGVPTVLTDVGTFSDYPAHAVCRVRWETEGQAGLNRTLFDLATRPDLRAAVGQSARDFVSTSQTWTQVAEQYVEAIERTHALGKLAKAPNRSGLGSSTTRTENSARSFSF